MNVTRRTYSPKDIENLPEIHVSTFLLVGHFLNEANWLRKLILIASMDESGPEPEEKARLALTLMLANVSASKIHGGWMRVRAMAKEPTLVPLFAQKDVSEPFDRLVPLLAEGSLLHKFRNRQGSHYPASLSLAQPPNIASNDVALFATPFDGDTLSLISTLCAAGSLIDVSGDQTVSAALETVIKALVEAFEIYGSLLLAMLFALVKNDIRAAGKQDIVGVGDACELSDIRLRFFCNPPSKWMGQETVCEGPAADGKSGV